MDEKFKTTKELMEFVVALVQAIVESVESNNHLLDPVNFIKPALLSLDLFKDRNQLPLEIKELDETQMQQLCDVVTATLNTTDKTDQVIKMSLDIGVKIFDLYAFVKGK